MGDGTHHGVIGKFVGASGWSKGLGYAQ